MKKKVVLLLLIFVLCVSILGIIYVNNKSKKVESNTVNETGVKYDNFEDVKGSDTKEIVYRNYLYQLGFFDTNNNTFERIYTENKQTVDSFSEDLNSKIVVTNTNSNENGSKCCFIENNSIKVIYETEGYASLLPLCTDGNNYYYIYEKYDKNGGTGNRDIVKIENGKKIDILKTKDQLIYSGAMCNNVIYYTIYVESKDKYEMCSLDLTSNKTQIIRDDLVDGKIYIYNGEVLFTGENRLYNDNIEIKLENKLSDIKIIQDKNVLLGYNVTSNGNLELQVIDMNTQQVLYNIDNICTYKYMDGVLKAYTCGEKGVIEYNLK